MAENVSVVFFPSLPLNVNRGPLGLIFSPWPGNRQTLNLSEWMGMDRNGWEWIGMDGNGSEWIGMGGNGSEWMRMPNSFFPLGLDYLHWIDSEYLITNKTNYVNCLMMIYFY
jgi:hypothetical protein